MVDDTKYDFHMPYGDTANKLLSINGQVSLLITQKHILAQTLGNHLCETSGGVLVIPSR